MADNVTSIQQFFANLAEAGRLMDHRFGLTITRSGMEDFTLFGQSTTIPARTVNKTPIHYFGQQVDIPTTLDEGRTWSVELYTDSKNAFYNRLRSWQEEYANWRNSGGGYKGVTSINVYIDLYNNNMDEIVDTMVLSGVWPEEVGSMNLDMAGDGLASFNLTLSFVTSYSNKYSSDPLR